MSALQFSRKTRQGSKHDRTGCITCRKRHKKCTPNTFPTCGNCARLNLHCVREPRRNILPEATSRSAVDIQREREFRFGADNSISIDDGDNIGIGATPNHDDMRLPSYIPKPNVDKLILNRAAMSYYISVMARQLTVSEAHNSFLTVYIPLALESPALCDAVRAWAWSHISLIDQTYDLLAAESRLTAIRAISAALLNSMAHSHSSEANVAACLVLLSLDIGRGDFGSWYNHLSGARDIMLSACSDGAIGIEAFKGTPEGRWLLRNFAYHDIIGSVTRGKSPLLEGHYLKGITDEIDSYLGAASEILIHVSDINQITPSSMHNLSLADRVNARFKAARIEHELSEWKYQSDIPADLASLADALRSSALILLYQSWRRLLPSSSEALRFSMDESVALRDKVKNELKAVLKAVKSIPEGAAAEAALLFPLFMAGSEAAELEDCAFIRTRLRLTLRRRYFRNISQTLDILEQIWQHRCTHSDSNIGESLSWRELIGPSDMQLLLT